MTDEEIEYLVAKYLENLRISSASLDTRRDRDRRLGFIAGLKAANSGMKLDKPKVVCFCGSTRFAEWFMIKRWELEKQGIITFGINILPNNYFAEGNAHGAEQENVKDILDELHKRKIDLSDEVYVLNVGGYIGESTRNEINYALSVNKPVVYLEPPTNNPNKV